ncbi:HD domain-containing protein [Actinoplanes sp. RD1]|uniref:HD domain-containing protein n=1 Tax=Actinoplanes sp. RD1 TaxID=3064538 RepID=UPI002741B580|nr:ATP-binding protein [Actinoplanes sp. RD1]
MPEAFEETQLWRRTLGSPGAEGMAAKATMTGVYLRFREAVAHLAGEVGRTMPSFTDHSIAHADALWDTASLLCGPDFPLNPAEAFVLGGAFLMHDLGMALSVLPQGLESLERDRRYPGLLQAALERQTAPGDAIERAKAEQLARTEALCELVRRLHAGAAERLVAEVFRTPDGQPFYLLENVQLRHTFGALIGRVAASHGEDVADLAGLDQRRGSSVDHPPHWEVDPLKIACVLRLADIAHIDQRRAPVYLHAYRRPSGDAHSHWYFQGRLTRPRVEGDRLVYTATEPFRREESNAWWLAQETIRSIDDELRRVDALCADLGRPRFPVRAVAGADSPQRLAKYIHTSGWEPIDAKLRVTDAVGLIANLGGEDLYGHRPEIALRELVANASDATKARRLIDDAAESPVHVDLRQEDGHWWLTVTDRGIGMSRETMVTALTDFGRSHWRSHLMNDLPDPPTRTFRPTGRFGIGFFAVFMVADQVQVRSLAYGEALATTHLLEFADGVGGRPILRLAEPAERLRAWGTEVRLRLREDPRSLDGLFKTDQRRLSHTQLLHGRIAKLCALSDVDITAQGPDDPSPVTVIRGGDWLTIPSAELFRRLYWREEAAQLDRLMIDGYERLFADRAEVVLDSSGAVTGRAMLATGWENVYPDMRWFRQLEGHVYVGGFHSGELESCMGAFIGEPLTADRLRSFPTFDLAELHRWLDAQAEDAATSPGSHHRERRMAGVVARGWGAQAPMAPCAESAEGPLDREGLRSWLSGKSEILLLSRSTIEPSQVSATHKMTFRTWDGRDVDPPDHVLFVGLNPMWLFPEEVLPRPRDESFADVIERDSGWDVRSWWYDTGNFGTPGLVVRTIAETWGIGVATAVAGMEALHVTDGRDRRPVLPTRDGRGIRVTAVRMRCPSPQR